MILFVFEGEEREPKLYSTLERIFLGRGDGYICCSFGNNIYELYREMKGLGGFGDIVDVLRARLASRGDDTLRGLRSRQVHGPRFLRNFASG